MPPRSWPVLTTARTCASTSFSTCSTRSPRARTTRCFSWSFIRPIELWFKLILHELDRATAELEAGRPQAAMAPLHRTTRVDELLIGQLRVLETLTPEGFLEFRDPLKPASGLQSGQFRAIEVLGGLDGTAPAGTSPLSEHDREELRRRAASPTLFSALCASLRAHGFDAPEGDGTELRERRIDALVSLYRDHSSPGASDPPPRVRAAPRSR